MQRQTPHLIRRLARRLLPAAVAVATAVAVVVVAPAAGPAAAWPAPGGSPDTVLTSGGAVRGTVSADGRRFSGIPYAAPPTGALRFAAPQPPAPWSGVRDATRTPPSCAQFGTDTEDCLIVNVSTPPVTPPAGTARGAHPRRLPVMVWLHGGAYTLGSAAGYDPTPLVTRGGVVVVGVNYRLGPLGFLTLPGAAPNAALLDQQAALRWVRRNIAAFGGDPGNVTLFGESAGGHSVCMQLVSPGARGLFRRAISQSGGCTGTGLGPVPRAQADAASLRLATAAGCTDPATALACLRAKPAAAVVAAGGGILDLQWVPALDGAVVPRDMRAALASGRYNRVPLVVGSNRDEGRLFVWLQYHLGLGRAATQAEYEAWVRRLAGPDPARGDAALARYTPAAYGSRDLAMAAAMTDSTFACPAVETVRIGQAAARRWPSRSRQPVFQYEFADPQAPVMIPDPLMPLGAYHSAELYYLFATLQGIPPFTPLTPAQRQLSDEMIRAWTAFARTGDPNAAGAPAGVGRWPAVRGRDPAVLSLRPGGTSRLVRTVDDEHQCRFWLTPAR
jgi:para-nitrobenzyl esterase